MKACWHRYFYLRCTQYKSCINLNSKSSLPLNKNYHGQCWVVLGKYLHDILQQSYFQTKRQLWETAAKCFAEINSCKDAKNNNCYLIAKTNLTLMYASRPRSEISLDEVNKLFIILLYGLFSAIQKKKNIIKNTGSNFQHPLARARGHSRSCSLN